MRIKTLLSVLFLGGLTAAAQYQPSHPKYITYIDGGKSFQEYFPTWEPGTQLSEDENFFISRVKIKDRFVNRNTQVVSNEKNNQRKFSMCVPMGISDTYWQTLPRYVMDGDNFSMWSYVDSQGGWSTSWIRAVGAYSDVCHKNGVANSGGVIFFDSWGGDNTGPQAIVNMLVTKNSDGSFKYLDKFIKFLRYYGIDGVTFNPEGTIQNAPLLQDFIAEVVEKAPEYGWQFHVYWYATNTNAGYLDLGSYLHDNNCDWFVKNGKVVCDTYFLNYNWSNILTSSTTKAESLLKGSSNNIYAGFDIQGNWLGGGNWSRLKNTNCSFIFWGNHTTDMIYQNSSDYGTTDEAVQRAYLEKQELVFSGGNRNPAKTPTVTSTTGVTNSGPTAMKKFHGVCALLPARSTLQELPFVTRFSLGNGKVFRVNGVETFKSKWYSLSAQDYLPTWRWWTTTGAGTVPTSGLIEMGFSFDDSWYGGSCMTAKGATTTSVVRLFKTNFNVSASDDVNLVYKLLGTSESHAQLFWSFVDSEDELHYADIPAASEGQWKTWQTTAQALGMTGNVALLGVKYSNTPAEYEMRFGEFGIVPQKSFSPVKPTVQKATFLERTYNSVSYKLVWDCGKSAAAKADASMPTYNSDVDTWYFEVYSQAEGQEPVLDGVTTSWAHYVVGAKSDPTVNNYRFGVRAVAPDGTTASEIAWSDYQTIDAKQIEGISLDKACIKANEEFTLGFTDPFHANAKKWQIVDAATGADVVTPAENATKLTTSISKLGTYDVVLTMASGEVLKYRAFVQITPDETGALPLIDDFTADKTTLTSADKSTNVTLNVKRLGEGKISHGLQLEDAYQFRIPSEALPAATPNFTVGCWIKPTMFAHSKYGTNLFNKRNVKDSWPHNNWGAFWTHIWPTWSYNDEVILDDNVIALTMYNGRDGGKTDPAFAGNANYHETPNTKCVTDRHFSADETYALELDTWAHVMISFDGTNEKIFFNGKKVCETPATLHSEYGECPIYVGGSNVYHAGLIGVIDDVQVWHKALTEAEVQEAMLGYEGKTVPTELKAYYTFESYDSDYNFPNLGSGGASLKGAYIALTDASGESTSSAGEEILKPNTDVLGNPALPGTLEVKTTGTLSVVNAAAPQYTFSQAATAPSCVLTFPNVPTGAYNVTYELSNMWGTATLTKPSYINFDNPEGIEDITGPLLSKTAVYNIQGQRVNNMSRGVYVVNGKKVVK